MVYHMSLSIQVQPIGLYNLVWFDIVSLNLVTLSIMGLSTRWLPNPCFRDIDSRNVCRQFLNVSWFSFIVSKSVLGFFVCIPDLVSLFLLFGSFFKVKSSSGIHLSWTFVSYVMDFLSSYLKKLTINDFMLSKFLRLFLPSFFVYFLISLSGTLLRNSKIRWFTMLYLLKWHNAFVLESK